jgi:type I restriction enzyme S subunit
MCTRPSVFDNNVMAIIPREIDAKYLHYWLSTVDLGQLANPGPVPSINEGPLRDLLVPEAALEIQAAIAAFLDAETTRIDALIGRKKALAALLAERRFALTFDAVSGSLESNGPRVSSSIAWLDDRPVHWKEVLLRLVARLGTGHTPSRDHPEWWENVTIPWITTGEVAELRSDRTEFLVETREKISELGLANSSAVVHPAGTVVLCRTASAGYSAIMGFDMATSQDFATWTCGNQLEPRFLLLCLRAMREDLLGRLAMGSTHKTIYMPDIQGLRIPLPTRSEQGTIVEQTWSRLRRIDSATDRLSQQIDLLEERRQVLITTAVTGELDVRGVSAP